MRCKACGHRFAVNCYVGHAPGGQQAPGDFLLVALAGVGLAGISLIWGGIVLMTIGIVTALVAASQIPVAMIDCRGRCPKCEAKYGVFPWSR